MKPLLLLPALFTLQLSAQSLDYLSVRKANGRVVKNVYTGSRVGFLTTDNRYLEGPVEAIRADSLYLRQYDIRKYRTVWGSVVSDTITTWLAGFRRDDIARVEIKRRFSFWQRRTGPLLMLSGGGYLILNVLNGGLADSSAGNRRRQAIAAGAAGLGYLFGKLFQPDGFTKRRHRIVYVDL